MELSAQVLPVEQKNHRDRTHDARCFLSFFLSLQATAWPTRLRNPLHAPFFDVRGTIPFSFVVLFISLSVYIYRYIIRDERDEERQSRSFECNREKSNARERASK